MVQGPGVDLPPLLGMLPWPSFLASLSWFLLLGGRGDAGLRMNEGGQALAPLSRRQAAGAQQMRPLLLIPPQGRQERELLVLCRPVCTCPGASHVLP